VNSQFSGQASSSIGKRMQMAWCLRYGGCDQVLDRGHGVGPFVMFDESSVTGNFFIAAS